MELLFNLPGMPKVVQELARFRESFKRQDIDAYRDSGGVIKQYYEEVRTCTKVRFHDECCKDARIAVFSFDRKVGTWVYEYEDRCD